MDTETAFLWRQNLPNGSWECQKTSWQPAAPGGQLFSSEQHHLGTNRTFPAASGERRCAQCLHLQKVPRAPFLSQLSTCISHKRTINYLNRHNTGSRSALTHVSLSTSGLQPLNYPPKRLKASLLSSLMSSSSCMQCLTCQVWLSAPAWLNLARHISILWILVGLGCKMDTEPLRTLLMELFRVLRASKGGQQLNKEFWKT